MTNERMTNGEQDETPRRWSLAASRLDAVRSAKPQAATDAIHPNHIVPLRRFLSLLLSFILILQWGCSGTHQSAQPSTQLDRTRAQQAEQSRNFAADENEDDEGFAGMVLGALATPFVALGNAMSQSRGDNPATAARKMDDLNSPDLRRIGTAEMVTKWDFAKHPPYTTRYKQIAQNDPDYTTRAMAIRALNIARDASATPIFIAALNDDHEIIRLEAAKALANIPDPKAVPALLQLLDGQRESLVDGRLEMVDESKDVRIAAADALKHYHTQDVARTLVHALNEREFGVAWQSRHSLIVLTGHDLKYDEAAWLAFLAGPNKPFG